MGTSGTPDKAEANLKKHGIDFADAALSLEDSRALVDADPDAVDEERFVCLGTDPEGRLLVTVYAQRGDNARIISSREASLGEHRRYEER